MAGRHGSPTFLSTSSRRCVYGLDCDFEGIVVSYSVCYCMNILTQSWKLYGGSWWCGVQWFVKARRAEFVCDTFFTNLIVGSVMDAAGAVKGSGGEGLATSLL